MYYLLLYHVLELNINYYRCDLTYGPGTIQAV